MIQELEKDKWLCTISQKKFKAPEFVRKHILNKFGDQVEEVKMDVEFFNNYIRDDKRPSMPLAPPNLTSRGQEEPRQMKRTAEMAGGGGGRREFQVFPSIWDYYLHHPQNAKNGVCVVGGFMKFNKRNVSPRTSHQQREASRNVWETVVFE